MATKPDDLRLQMLGQNETPGPLRRAGNAVRGGIPKVEDALERSDPTPKAPVAPDPNKGGMTQVDFFKKVPDKVDSQTRAKQLAELLRKRDMEK